MTDERDNDMKNAARQVVAHEPAPPAEVVRADPASVMAVVARMAQDPSVDVDKLERMVAMAERLQSKDAERQFNEAMNAAQAEMRRISADADNPQTRSKYASYAALDREVRPLYTKHGFSLSFGTEDATTPDMVKVTCTVAHSAGNSRHYGVVIPADGKGAKGGDVMTKTHAVGAALSYGQRYLLRLIFNIAVGDDEDGNMPSDFLFPEELEALTNRMNEVGANRDDFCNFLKVDTLAHLPRKSFKAAMAALDAKAKRAKADATKGA